MRRDRTVLADGGFVALSRPLVSVYVFPENTCATLFSAP